MLASGLVLFAPLLCGGLMCLAFVPGSACLLAWVALLPLAWASSRRGRMPELLLGSFIGGLLFHLVQLDWMRTTYGGTGLEGPRANAWLLSSAICAASWPVAAGLLRLLNACWRGRLGLATGTAWVAGEWLRYQGTSAIDGNGFPWLQLGHSQIDLGPLAQLADIGGVWGISWLVAAVNGAAVGLFDAKTRRRSAMLVAALVAGSWMYGTICLGGTRGEFGPVIMAVAAKVDPTNADRLRAEMAKHTAADGRGLPVVFAWPEQSEGRRLWIAGDRDSSARIAALSHSATASGAVLVVGCRRQVGSCVFNSLAWFTPDHGLSAYTDKQRLVAWTERDPGTGFDVARLGSCDFEPGAANGPIVRIAADGWARGYLAAGGVCYDACFPERWRALLRASSKTAPELLIAASCEQSDVSGQLADWAEIQARFRAIETRRPVIRSVAGGRSTMIDSSGSVLSAGVGDFVNLGMVPLGSQCALYPYIGDALPWMCCLSPLGLLLRVPRSLSWQRTR